MTENDKKKALTPSAKETLESIVNEYRERIFDEAYMRAMSLPGGEKEISVRDILEGVDRINHRQRRVKAKRFEAVLQIYSIIGVMLSLVGAAFFLYGKIRFSLDIQDRLIIALIVSGLILGLSPYFFRKMRHVFEISSEPNQDRQINSNLIFINKWKAIEDELRHLIEQSGETATRQPLSSVVQSLQSKGIITNDDADALKQLLSLRNEIVHESHTVDRKHLDSAFSEAERVLNKLKS